MPQQYLCLGHLHFTGNSELILPEAIEKIIAYNMLLCKQKGKQFGVRRNVLDDIRKSVNNQSDIVNAKHRMAKRAANLLSGFAIKFPFDHENVNTGMALIVDYLESNGFSLSNDMVGDLYRIVQANMTTSNMRGKLEVYLIKNLGSKN